jgi:hypothetical protein
MKINAIKKFKKGRVFSTGIKLANVFNVEMIVPIANPLSTYLGA